MGSWTPETITALIIAITGLVGAVAGIFSARKAHQKINALTKPDISAGENVTQT